MAQSGYERGRESGNLRPMAIGWRKQGNLGVGSAHGAPGTGGREGRGERRGDGLVTRFFPERYLYCYLTRNFRLERQWRVVVKYGVGPSLAGIMPTVIVFWLWVL